MKIFVLCVVLMSLVAVNLANGPADGPGGNWNGENGGPWRNANGNGRPWGGDGERKWGKKIKIFTSVF